MNNNNIHNRKQILVNDEKFTKYILKLNLRSVSTQKQFRWMINNITKYGEINLQNLQFEQEEIIYDNLQKWINWNHSRGVCATTIICLFNSCRSYLWHVGIKLYKMDIKENLKFPRPIYANRLPITKLEIERILASSNPEFRFQLLTLISSGMRVSEMGQIKVSHLDMTKPNIMVNLPGNITKTRRGRITFLSKQVSSMVRHKLKNDVKIDDQHVFCGERSSSQAQNLIIKRFAASRKRAEIMSKHEHCMQNRYKIHVHTMRAYFITKANQVQFGIGHILAGHNFYMKEYNLYTVDELHKYYKKIDKLLTFDIIR